MKLDAELFSYLTKVEWRVLEAVEIGMKNHNLVPVPLISRIANLRRTGIQCVLSSLLKHKLLAHDSKVYDGYKLTYLGYDFLSLRPFVARGLLVGVGMRMGVGKESDIHICKGAEGRTVIVKLHRLGRISFRSIKRNRDYLGRRQSASWMYLARLAAAKEFAFMKALRENGFPVPEPIDVNRHAIVMEYIDGYPLAQVKELEHPKRVLETLMGLIVRMAESGLIHADFNEFNLMISDEEKLTLIDFPQVVSVHHPNAEFYFDRDVECLRSFFKTKFGLEVTKYPQFSEMKIPELNCIAAQKSEEARFSEAFELHRLHLEKREKESRGLVIDSDEDDESIGCTDEEKEGEEKDFAKLNRSDECVGVKETDCESGDSDDDQSEEQSLTINDEAPKRLDNVWRPVMKRKTANTACSDKRKKNKRSTKGEAGKKRNRKTMKIRAQLQHDW